VVFDNPINVHCDSHRDHAVMAHDASPSGLVFRSHTLYAIGERVELTFKVETDEHHASGRVVRSWTVLDPYEVFPHRAAVEFDEPFDAFTA
jgi:hypothetical protein